MQAQNPGSPCMDPTISGSQSVPDRTFEAARQLMPYQFGSLWWGRDDLIKSKQQEFVRRDDRIGHPLLSVKRDELKCRQDSIPMLLGTSGTNLRETTRQGCVQVSGLTSYDPEHVTYFGSIVAPGLYGFDDLLDGVARKRHSLHCRKDFFEGEPENILHQVKWFELRVMCPNGDKPRVNEAEERCLKEFCSCHGL